MAKITLPDGKKVEGVIKEGKTYLADGSRVPVGSTVDTGAGGTWKMTDNGGVKVDTSDNAGSWISNKSKAKSNVSDTGEQRYGGTNSSSSNVVTTQNNTYEQEINELKTMQQRLTAQQLQQSQEKSLTELERQRTTIPETYRTARNQVSAQSQLGAKNFAEYLANRGLTNSGASAQGEINRIGNLNAGINSLNAQEIKANQDIDNQIYDIKRDTAFSQANANLQLENEFLERKYTENQRRRQQEEQLKAQSLYQYSEDYQAKINELLAKGYSPNSPEILQLEALRGEKVANIESGAYREVGLQNILNGNITYNNAIMAGFKSVEEAQQYYNNYMVQLQAQAEQEAQQQAFDNYIKEQTLQNSIRNTNSLINNRNSNSDNDGSGESLRKVQTEKLNKMVGLLRGLYGNDKVAIIDILEKVTERKIIAEDEAEILASKLGIL